MEYVGANVGEGGEEVGRVSYVGAGECESFDVGWAFRPRALETEGGVEGPGEGSSARARTEVVSWLAQQKDERRKGVCVREGGSWSGAQHQPDLLIRPWQARRDQKPLLSSPTCPLKASQ